MDPPIEMNRLPTKVTVFAIVLSLHLCSAQIALNEHANDVDSAKQFVQAIYARYGPNGDPPTLFEENSGTVFHSSLIALARG